MVRSALKLIIKRRSTQVRLQNLQDAINAFWNERVKELKHGKDLQAYCRGKTGILLHVGCGDFIQKGWVNVDFIPRSGVFFFNMLNPLPLETRSVAQIHAEHFLEHLEYSDVIRFLTECHRILQDGGTMRIIVPDAEKYMRAYASDDKSFFEGVKNLGNASEPFPTKGAICNQMFRMGGDHRFAWDFETLEYVARLAGFSSIERSHHNDKTVSNCIDAQDWWRPVESLYANLKR